MAVAHHGTTGGNNNTSTASTTVGFVVPSVVTSGDVWICSACFRGGSAATISGVPGGFTQIIRTDSGSGSTNVVIVSYSYTASGSESGTFATITISGSSKYVTLVDAFSGVNTTTPVVAGSSQSAVGTSAQITTAALAALGTGQLAFGFGAQQGVANSAPAVDNANGTNSASSGGSTSGGSAATNVGNNSGWVTAVTDSASQTWHATAGSWSTDAVHAFILDVPGTAATSDVPLPRNRRFDMRLLMKRSP